MSSNLPPLFIYHHYVCVYCNFTTEDKMNKIVVKSGISVFMLGHMRFQTSDNGGGGSISGKVS